MTDYRCKGYESKAERAFDIVNGTQTPPLCRCCYSRRTGGKPTCQPCYDECTNEGCVIGAAADLPVQGERFVCPVFGETSEPHGDADCKATHTPVQGEP